MRANSQTYRSMIAGAFLCLTAVVHADVPPPEGYVETCTVEKQQKDGLACVACSGYHGALDACEKQYGPQGYTKACQSAGASVWTEVWCKPDPASKGAASPASKGPGGQGAASQGAGGQGPGGQGAASQGASQGSNAPAPAGTSSGKGAGCHSAGTDATGFLPVFLSILALGLVPWLRSRKATQA